MFENGKLDSRQAFFPERLERPTLSDAPPGTAWYIDINALWMDEMGRAWINTEYPLGHDQNDFDTVYCRTIVFEEGIAVDLTNTRDENDQLYTFYRRGIEDIIEEFGDLNQFEKIIAFAASQEESKKLKSIFKARYGYNLKGEPNKIKNPNKKDNKPKPPATNYAPNN